MSIRAKASLIGTINVDGKASLIGTMNADRVVHIGGSVSLQEKIVTPSQVAQTVTFDSGYNGLLKVLVEAIPEQYGLVAYDQDKTITIT